MIWNIGDWEIWKTNCTFLKKAIFMYCYQIKIGDLFVLKNYKGKLCTYQNVWIFKKNWLKFSPPTLFVKNIKKLTKMTWLHLFFGLFFVPANGWAELAQWLKTTVLLFLHQCNFGTNQLGSFWGHWGQKRPLDQEVGIWVWLFSRFKSNQSIYLKD